MTCPCRIVKTVVWALVISVVVGLSVLFAMSILVRGPKYLPTMTKELTKNLLLRGYGPQTIPTPKALCQYSKLFVKSLIASEADVYQERILDFDVSFFDYADLMGFFGEIFIKELYYFSTQKRDPFIIDAGGNIGMATLYFKMLYPQAEIMVFEPSQRCFEVLQKNIRDNGFANVTVINKALSNKEGTVSFWDPSHGKGCGSASIIVNRSDNNMTTVPCDTLSRYITKPVDLLKMDIESAEHLVLEDLVAADKLKFIKEIIMEYHHHMPKNTIDLLGNFLTILEKNNFGYQIRGCNWGIAYQFDPEQGQVLFIHAYQKIGN